MFGRLQKGFATGVGGGGRCPAEGVEAVGRSDSVARTDYPLPCR